MIICEDNTVVAKSDFWSKMLVIPVAVLDVFRQVELLALHDFP